ncbi:hypothetical protein PYW08_012030 [Mythimna loreyi]|uniref:Uncharacterized protein n=1 Tax=Mythimna loreyi TaxID=667449 RepID=A0ACC2QNN9_9NEOP|nr:hypothetical protein PYW08_012030 [Mythimna loreyi]
MMNGLALRINRGGGGKSKNSMGYSSIAIPTSLFENTDDNNADIQAFIESPSSDDQLAILKKIIEANKDSFHDGFMKFLVAAFFHAEAKHPIKCFISRHIIKNKHLQQPFSEALALQISALVSNKSSNYKQYVDIANKLLTSIENFQAGVVALRSVQRLLAEYLTGCLECCVATLREQETLSPVEKNEIFTLAHTSLRLLLHLVQKGTPDDISVLMRHFDSIRTVMQDLMFDDDVPMDTKSVCGILYLTMHVVEYGENSWIEVLDSSTTDTYLRNLLGLEAGRLSLYSAIPTVVAVDHLFTRTVDDGPGIVTLTNKILEIGDRSSSESAFILGVARTLLQISKLLDKLSDSATGLTLVNALLLFSWGHLEHYMDSVRHLTGQVLGCVVKYCAKMDRAGDNAALVSLTAALQTLERSRKSFYVCVSWLAAELSARDVLAVVHTSDVIHALHDQRLRNTASAALDAMLVKLCAECTLEQLRTALVDACVQSAAHADSAQLGVLEQLLARACARRPDLLTVLLPYIKESGELAPQPQDLKCVLMLLRVCRKSTVTHALSHAGDAEWKGVISYKVLKRAAVDAVDETRILSLNLIVESPKSTEVFAAGELRFVLHFLKYNINAQAPNFRQLTMSAMKKFIKRFEQSYAVIKRERQPNGVSDKVAYYLRFAEDLRRLCFHSLIPGTNYSRRFVALQVLAWCEQITLEGYERSWEPEYVEKLLLHLEDSYENNKAFALEVLASCPDHLLRSKKYTISLDIEDILLQASSLKPTECVSAAFKLDLLRTKLPDYILQDETCSVRASPVQFALCSRLLRAARAQLAVCARSVLAGAARAPMYGALHCLARNIQHLDAREISSDEQWTRLVADIIDTCMEVNAAVACVVNNSSPEGHLPMDMTVQVTDHGNTGNVTLDDGRQVTAQMVLLCAWRSVKEVSLLLGAICGRLSVEGEGDGASECRATLHAAQLQRVGEHFTSLLAETKHRGAFEQAYVGFTLLLDRLWRCRSPELHGLPRRWLAQLMRAIAEGEGALCATRRSAGVPFIIQALVTTELQVQGNPLCFHGCITELLELSASGSAEARGHALHVLRALFRHAALGERVAPHVARGLVAALHAFDAHSWASAWRRTWRAGSWPRCTPSTRTAGPYVSLYTTHALHALHVLRALFRHAALGERVAPHVARGLVAALHAFDAHSWAVRITLHYTRAARAARAVPARRAGRARGAARGARARGRAARLRRAQLGRTYHSTLHTRCTRCTCCARCSGTPRWESAWRRTWRAGSWPRCTPSTRTAGPYVSLYTTHALHALHVLRALFRHAALGERVAPHVARGLVAALHAFDAHSWAVRITLHYTRAARAARAARAVPARRAGRARGAARGARARGRAARLRRAQLGRTYHSTLHTRCTRCTCCARCSGTPRWESAWRRTWRAGSWPRCTPSTRTAGPYVSLYTTHALHALHVLRALFRHAALGERVAPHVARGLVAALHAFDAHSWAERNSSTLLLSALVQRVFGVQRSTMTGRIFFLRYPEVYDFMLEKLQEVSKESDSEVLRPSLYPVLLLLARLYPSSLEGTVSNLKLVAFIPHVLACARSGVMKTRQLAAKAIVPLISPEQYISHIQSMFELLHDSSIKRNYCHGILLQLVRLLQARGGEGGVALAQLWPAWASNAMWMLGWPGQVPCYLVADEFVKVLNLLIMRSPNVPQETVTDICSNLRILIFAPKPTTITPGRDICLSNAMYLYLILATQHYCTDTSDLVYKGLQHSSYEVVLSILNYLLILHKDLEAENSMFHEHLKSIADTTTLSNIKNDSYIKLLCKVLKSNYLECQEKSLKILVLEGNTQRYILETKLGVSVTEDMIIDKLFDFIQNEHEKVTHIYLQSLLNFVTDQIQDSRICLRVLLDVMRVVFECSSSENSEDTRRVVVGFIEKNIRQLLRSNKLEEENSKLSEAERFELRATIWATIITLLEDDEDAIRQRVSDVLSPTRVTPSRSGELALHLMRERGSEELEDGEGGDERDTALFALIALLDFQSVVVVADDVNDECRVFDQNERYNIYLEETIWTIACADILMNDYKANDATLTAIIDKPAYKQTFDKLCKDNIEVFRKMAAGQKLPRNDALNPKIELFVNKLRVR